MILLITGMKGLSVAGILEFSLIGHFASGWLRV
jgi:hypothetical protein